MERLTILKRTSKSAAVRGALAALVLSAPLASASANAGVQDAVTGTVNAQERESKGEVNAYGCDGAEAFFTVPTERAKRWTPAAFHDRLVPNTGATEMFIRAYRCERQVVDDQVTLDTTTIIFGPIISDSRGRVMFFTNFYYSDNRDLITWFKAGTGSHIFHYLPDLKYEFEAVTAPTPDEAPIFGEVAPVQTGPFHISTEARGRAFSWEGMATPGLPLPVEGPSSKIVRPQKIVADWWFETASGGLGWFRNCIPYFGVSGAVATIRPAPGSELDTILGPFVATGAHVSSWFGHQRTTWRLDSTPPDVDADVDPCPWERRS